MGRGVGAFKRPRTSVGVDRHSVLRSRARGGEGAAHYAGGGGRGCSDGGLRPSFRATRTSWKKRGALRKPRPRSVGRRADNRVQANRRRSCTAARSRRQSAWGRRGVGTIPSLNHPEGEPKSETHVEALPLWLALVWSPKYQRTKKNQRTKRTKEQKNRREIKVIGRGF